VSREHELILELRAARRTVREAEIAEQEAAVKKAERKAERMKAAAAVEEILAEMDGTDNRPLLAAINGQAAANRGAGKPPDEPEEPESARPKNHREWDVFTYSEDALGHRGKWLGTVWCANRSDAISVAMTNPRWKEHTLMVIGDEHGGPGHFDQTVGPPASGLPPDEDEPESADERQRGPRAGKGTLEVGPASVHEALKAALNISAVRHALGELPTNLHGGATNEQVLEALSHWPVHRSKPGIGGGLAWAVVGGEMPKFFCGNGSGMWPQGEGLWTTERLIKEVRKVLKIADPKRKRPGKIDWGKTTAAVLKATAEPAPPDEPDEPESADERQRGPTVIAAPKKHWAVHKYDKKSKGKRGARAGTVTATCEDEARAALYTPLWQSKGYGELVLGDEIEPGSAPPGASPNGAPQSSTGQRPVRNARSERADRREKYVGPDPVATAAEHLAKLDAEANAQSPENASGPVQWTSADLEAELEDACYPPGFTGPGSPWADLREHGCDDRKILEVLRQIWPAAYRFDHLAAGSVGRTVHGGPTPAFWIGARKSTDWKVAPPTLEGLLLAARVRRVLEIPRASTFGGKAELPPRPGSVEALEGFSSFYKPEFRETIRVCNRCNTPRVPTVGLCPQCDSPEFRPYPTALAEARGENPPPVPSATAADREPVRKRRGKAVGV
jgi:hypothetical protein